jgi:hypothetical protein
MYSAKLDKKEPLFNRGYKEHFLRDLFFYM